MEPKTAEIGKGLRFIFVGVIVNLFTLLGGTAGSVAELGNFILTVSGLLFALRGEKKLAVPLAVLVVNNLGIAILRRTPISARAALVVLTANTLLSSLVICLICALTMPWVKDRAVAKRGGWAWKCNAASAVVAVSCLLMDGVPGEQAQMLRGVLSLMSLVLMAVAAVFYLVYLWQAGTILQKN